MGRKITLILAALMTPFALSAREGAPSYYQNAYKPSYQYAAGRYPEQNVYVGNAQIRQAVGQRSYSYQVPRQTNTLFNGTMTANGVAIPPENKQNDIVLTAAYGRKFADFQFETGVQSILEWDDMIINEVTFHAEKDFQVRNYNMFAFGEYSYGILSSGGLSMDYDLKPYNDANPQYGIFTISMGGQTGKMQDMKFGVGARHIWDIAGWKISPIIGYQIFKHDLKMDNHIYPNPAVYIPLMNQYGDYIYGDTTGNYYSVTPGTAVPDDYYQVCMSPEYLGLAASDPITHSPVIDADGNLLTTTYDPLYTYQPWGVAPGECVVLGGDGMIIVEGTTHIYNTTWSGIFLALEIEKQLTYIDKLRFYAQVSMPHYKSEGIWPNRTDWQQNPSFVDEGDNGAMQYQMEMEYIYQFSDRLQLSLKADMSYFQIGAVGGELYVAGYQYYVTDEQGFLVCQDILTGNVGAAYCETGGAAVLATQNPYTEKVTDSLKSAVWQSFGLHLGVKYAF